MTIDFWIQLDHRVAVVGPEMGPTSTAVVVGQAPDQTVGPGIWYVVAHGVVGSGLVCVEQYI